MSQTERERTCQERIAAHQASRLQHIGALNDLVDAHDEASLSEALEDTNSRELFCELVTVELFGSIVGGAGGVPEPLHADDVAALDAAQLADLLGDFDYDTLRERAEQQMQELPLGVSSKTVFRIDLSTGGPGDWLDVECSGDTPNYEPAGSGEHYEVTRITYHFNDWFDHAERALEGAELETAERFAQQVVPELIG